MVTIESCTNGDVQLTGSESVTEGVVEICVDNTWGSICNDSWGQQEAAVVCKQLGFQSARKCRCCNYFIDGSALINNIIFIQIQVPTLLCCP